MFHFNTVQITVKGFPQTLIQEQFSFSFANKTMIGDAEPTGFHATAAFTFSAIPEPATVILLGLDSLALLRRRKM
ncbi:PEP-CTERM sorting domain-containing protein [Planctomycetota bacterium]